jgi:hypothetical protein
LAVGPIGRLCDGEEEEESVSAAQVRLSKRIGR